MVEQERLTNKERRARAREERQRREAEAARRARMARLRSLAIAAVVFVAVGAVLYVAIAGGPETIDEAITLTAADVEEARTSAECEIVEQRSDFDRTHFDAASAPPADAMYSGTRPSLGGPHLQQAHPVVTAGADNQLDERATTHNLEHGAVLVWYDPEQVDGDTVGEIEAWSETLNENGFSDARAGTAVMVSPYTDPGISSGKPIALRAWGVATDCAGWNETAANAFVYDYFATHGIAPERFLDFPEDKLTYDGDPPETGFTPEDVDESRMSPEGSVAPSAVAPPPGSEPAGEGAAPSE